MKPDDISPCGESAGCLKVPYIDESGKQAWIRFILADEDLHRETAASLGQPFPTDEERAVMLKDIRF